MSSRGKMRCRVVNGQDMTGQEYLRIFIVTGATAGIGYYTVQNLAAHNAKVYLCVRSAEKGDDTVLAIKKLYPKADLQVLVMDHTSLATVVSASESFLSHSLTKDGHATEWQTNYLAHWVFTCRLLPCLLRTAKVSKPGDLTKDIGMTQYGQSKLANILHAKTLHRLYGPNSQHAKGGKGEIWTSAVHPRASRIFSQLAGRTTDANLQRLLKFFNFFGGYVNGDIGSYTSVFCGASSEMKSEQSGKYFVRIAKVASHADPLSPSAKNDVVRDKLEQWTQKTMSLEGWV
ncbi:NAD(P)-binding protein [Patellaria atrata CBS 101060]|uniref:NAD(P)-binding protein n=1 Tax=Patellaria atrata CBS 101060 TaxID=1346257 RepID=A0A9P4S8E3_9PEZI|nr:NAD(P)-binding protein [Patellaria atrata CBS 101060]